MRVQDKNGYLTPQIIADANRYESTAAMFEAGAFYEREATASAVTGLIVTGLGAAISMLGRRHGSLKTFGKGVMLGGSVELVTAAADWELHDALHHGAGMIEWGQAAKKVDILPDIQTS
jgi:hypothetical protein